MSKYTKEFKLEVIEYYQKSRGLKRTAKHFNITSDYTVSKWVRQYKEHGVKGLLKKQKQI